MTDMSDLRYDPAQQVDVLKAVVGLIEEIRYKRYDEWRDKLHPLGHTFTQLELIQVALPTYGNLLAGRSKRLPARQQILEIAEYLECTIAETNDLLRSAQYLPEYDLLTQPKRKLAIARAKLLLHSLPLPGLILEHTGDVLDANMPEIRGQSLPPMSEWQPDQFNIVRWALDSKLPTYAQYNLTPAFSAKAQRTTATLIYSMNRQFLYEPVIQQKLSEYHQLAGFTSAWKNVVQDSDDNTHDNYNPLLLDQVFTETTHLIPLTPNAEISLCFFTPVGEAAYHVYRKIGCAIDDTRWHEMIHDLNVKRV